jgi:hypothetical protein
VTTPIGSNGRMPPGESWRRAMEEAGRRIAEGSTRRYRVQARRVEPGWWAYELKKVSRNLQVPASMPQTLEQLRELHQTLPRCAQRATTRHGGGFKVAYLSEALARRAAELTRGRPYQCKLPAPAIGEHWHHTTSKRRKR